VTGTLADIALKQEALIRKPLDGSVFRAPLTASHIDASTLFGASGQLLALPGGYNDVGLLNTDGIQTSRNISNADTNAFGRISPVRSDVTADTDTVAVTAIETKLETISLGTGAVLTAASILNTNGSLQIKKPARPSPRLSKWLTIAVDENEFGEIYICRYFPRGKITAYGDQNFAADEIGWNVTVTGENDSAWGGPSSWMFGGPGWNALLVSMGFSAYAPSDVVAPTVPSGVVSAPNGGGRVTVSWSPSTDATSGVASYRLRSGGVDVPGAAAISSTQTSFQVTGLTTGPSPQYTVSAVDYAGNRSAESTASAVVTVT
jgi:hypothetical protein